MTHDVVVVGSTMVDLVTTITRMPDEGETLEARGFRQGFGGKGANQAVAAARRGASVAMVARVGDDDLGRSVRANLIDNGIDTGHVHTAEGVPNGVAPIFVDAQGHNRILIVKGANDHLMPSDVELARNTIAAARLVVLQLEIPLDTVRAAIALADEVGVPVLLNPAPADPDLHLADVVHCEWFIPNESELGLITGMPVDTLDEVRAAATSLRSQGLRNVVVTLGSRGVLWMADGIDELLPGIKVDAVDTTGAGDAFIGAFASELVKGPAVRDALKAANRYAADSVTRPGTQTSYA